MTCYLRKINYKGITRYTWVRKFRKIVKEKKVIIYES